MSVAMKSLPLNSKGAFILTASARRAQSADQSREQGARFWLPRSRAPDD
jgi:hypothetical protein